MSRYGALEFLILSRGLAPSSRIPGGMVLNEIDSYIKLLKNS